METDQQPTESGPQQKVLCLQRLVQCFQNFLLADPLWLRKITTDPHILAHVNMKCLDER